jgi:hypothetical protein
MQCLQVPGSLQHLTPSPVELRPRRFFSPLRQDSAGYYRVVVPREQKLPSGQANQPHQIKSVTISKGKMTQSRVLGKI